MEVIVAFMAGLGLLVLIMALMFIPLAWLVMLAWGDVGIAFNIKTINNEAGHSER